MATVYLGLGANLGDRRQNLTQSLDLLSRQAEIEQVSSVYETEPVGFKEQPLFLNAVCRIATKLSPRQLLSLVKKIEVTLGRIPSFPDAPRPIDIDILFYGNKIIKSQNLTIPHPRLVQRAFVLIPLAEIAPEVTHPENGKTVKELFSNLENTEGIRKWAEAAEIMNLNRRHNVPGIS
jgi:2-amino-4-hydroxy-6-hydroxymethyldihydropteridine diphosphokinase